LSVRASFAPAPPEGAKIREKLCFNIKTSDEKLLNIRLKCLAPSGGAGAKQ
jgi:hypothetical protein